MNVLRTRLPWLVTLWLVCHGVGLAAAPFALCCRDELVAAVAGGTAPAADDANCPLHAAAAAAAPAAVAAPGAGPDTVRSTCTPSDVALASLLGSVAVLPGVETPAATAVISAVTLEIPTLLTHVELPDAPPPRA